MRKFLIFVVAALALACAAPAHAQFTAVSGVILDPGGSPYINCKVSAAYVPAPTATTQALINGSTFPTTVSGVQCDSFGNIPPMSLVDNNQVSDGHTGAASQWNFSIQSASTCFAGNIVGFSVTLTITGASQNISAALQAAAATLPKCGGGGGGTTIALKTNGTTNTNQTVLNFVNGTNTAITSNSAGNETFSTTPNLSNTASIDNIYFVDGVTYPCTSTGVNAAITAAIAAFASTVDARGCVNLSITSTILVGTHATAYPMTLLVPTYGTWTIGNLGSGNCGIEVFNKSSVLGDAPAGTAAFSLVPNSGASLYAALCTDPAPIGGASYVHLSGVSAGNPNNATIATAMFNINHLFDNSTTDRLMAYNFPGNGFLFNDFCCGTTFRNTVSDGYGLASALPVIIGDAAITGGTNFGGAFYGLSAVHQGSGKQAIYISSANSSTFNSVSLHDVFLEWTTGGDGTTPFIVLNGAVSATFDNVNVNPDPSGTNYVFDIQNTGTINSILIHDVRQPTGTTNIVDNEITGTTVTGVNWLTDYEYMGSTAGECYSAPGLNSRTCTGGITAGFLQSFAYVTADTYFRGVEIADPGGIAASDILYGDSTAHRWKMHNNNGSGFLIPGVAAAGTSGHVVTFAANGIDLVDGGSSSTGITNQVIKGIPYNSSGTATLLDAAIAAPTTQGSYGCGYTVPTAAAVVPTCPLLGLVPDAAAGSSVLFSDNNSTIYNPPSAIAIPVPTTSVAGGGLGNANFFTVSVNNASTAVVWTPATWTISYNGQTAGSTATQPGHTKCALSVDQTASTQWDLDCVNVAGYGNTLAAPAAITIGSGASIGSTSLCATTICTVGTYQVSAYLDITTACGTSGTYLVSLIYTDDQGSKTVPINLSGTGAVPATGVVTTTSTSNFGQAVQVVRTTGAAAISYSTTAVACGSAGPMVGKLYLAVVPVVR